MPLPPPTLRRVHLLALGVAILAATLVHPSHSSGVYQQCDPGTGSPCVFGTCSADTLRCNCTAGYGRPACDMALDDPLFCGDLVRSLAHGDVTCTNLTSSAYNTTCTFSCLPGYTLSGSMERTCSMAGAWSGVDPLCSPVCTLPCVNATCSAPDVCECHTGYNVTVGSPDSHICLPVCTPPCVNGGSCVAPNSCDCPSNTFGRDCSGMDTEQSLRDRLTSASQPFNPSSYKFYVTWLMIILAIACAVGLFRHHRKKKKAAADGAAATAASNKVTPIPGSPSTAHVFNPDAGNPTPSTTPAALSPPQRHASAFPIHQDTQHSPYSSQQQQQQQQQPHQQPQPQPQAASLWT